MGKIIAVCVSEQKGTQKKNVGSAVLKTDWGIENDAHAGKWHRQVSLLSHEKVEQFRARVEKLRNTCSCCGQPMQYRTIMRLEYGSLDWLAGEYRAIDVAVFCCGVCGQVRMYDAFYLNGVYDPVLSITPPEARDNGAQLGNQSAPEPPPEKAERPEPEEKQERRGWFGRKKDKPDWEF